MNHEKSLAVQKFAAFVIALFAAPVFLWGAVSGIWQGYRTHRWNTANGRILGIEIRSEGTGGRRSQIVYKPFVSYRYEVGGETYSSSRITLKDSTFSDRKDAAEIGERYSEGPIPVYYDPAAPEKSVLIPGTSSEHWKEFAGGLVALLIAGLLGFGYARDLMNNPFRAADGGL
jgi:hypothetical protein